MIHLDDYHAGARVGELFDQRRRTRGAMLEAARAVTDVYNGDVVLPLPELSAQAKATVANITQQGLDQVSMRISSVMPNLLVPSMRPGYRQHDEVAADRRRAWHGMWGQQPLNLLMRQRARWLLGYAQSPVLIRPDFETQTVRWSARNPLHTFPASCAERIDMDPADVIFASRVRWATILARYPGPAAQLALASVRAGGEPDMDDVVELLDYYDADERILVAVGRTQGFDPVHGDAHHSPNPGRAVVLERTPNRAGVCPVVVPGRITLDRLVGAFDGVVGMYHTMTEMMGLSLLATKKGILGETWLVARPNETPNIVQAADPMAGLPGVVEGATLQHREMDAQWGTYAAVDRLEKASRETAGVPGDLTGSPSYARTTGRRADQLLSATIDFPIQEHQEILARSLELENQIAAKVDREYFGSVRRSFYVKFPKAKGHLDYVPSKLWDEHNNPCDVSYALAGADSMMLNVELAQRVGAGTMSKETAMGLDPMIEDIESEQAKIVAGRLSDAFLASIESMAANPEGPYQPADFARLLQLSEQGTPLHEAVMTVQREAQERQAEQTEDPAAAQPGLSPPGMGMEQELAATIGGPNESQANLAQLLRATTTTGYAM